jgi:hypothetical protein
MTSRHISCILLVAAIAVTACGGPDTKAADPTAPAVLADGSVGNGTSGTPTPVNAIMGTVSGLAGSCPALTFRLADKTIKTDASTAYGDGGCGDVKNGASAGAIGTAQADGSILASHVRVLPAAPVAPVPVIGTVSALSGTCPTVTFTLEGKTIKTNASTSFGDGKCADLKNDLKAGAIGAVQTDGSILAKQVRVMPPPAPVPVPVMGSVSAVSGTCPALTFKLDTKTIKTDANTNYGGGSCADVKNDGKAGVLGMVQTDGSILAQQVRVAPPMVAAASMISGAIATVTGACPAITITIGTKVAVTSAATVFSGKGCGDLKSGVNVDIYGTVASGGTSLAASKVVVK